jgi:hypothetical protein
MATMTPTPATLHILPALAKGDLTAPAIDNLVAEDSHGTMLMNESTLYKAYTLTPRGRRLLQSEKIRYQQVVSLMHQRLSK